MCSSSSNSSLTMRKLLTEKQRHTLSAVVLAVGLAVMPMSLSLLATTVYVRFVVDEELDLVQGMNTATLPYFLAVTGSYVVVGGGGVLVRLMVLVSVCDVLVGNDGGVVGGG